MTTAPEHINEEKCRKGRIFSEEQNSIYSDRCRVQQNRSVKGNMSNELYKAVSIKMDVLMKSDFKMKAQIQIISPVAKTNTYSAVISDVITSE